MTEQIRRHFIDVLFRVRKIDVCCDLVETLPLSEMAVLKRLLANGCMNGNGMNMSDIRRDLYISKPAVSQILNSLERKGYIERWIDLNDRRRIMVAATPKSYDAVMSTEAALDKKINKIIAEFGEENMMILINQLTRLYETFEKIENKDK